MKDLIIKILIGGASILGILIMPFVVDASIQNNTQNCSLTSLTSNCTGTQDFPDDGNGNEPVNGQYGVFPIQDSYGDPIGSINSALLTTSAGQIYQDNVFLFGTSSLLVSGSYLGGNIVFYNSSFVPFATTSASTVGGFPYLETFNFPLGASLFSDSTDFFCMDSFYSLIQCVSSDGATFGVIPSNNGNMTQVSNSSTSPLYTQDAGNLSLDFAILLTLCFIAFVSYLFNSMTKKH